MAAKLNKPTKEELKAKQEEAVAVADELEGSQQLPPEDTDTPEEPVQEEITTPEVEPSEEDKQQLKTKLSASARENQKIYAKNRVINQALVEADSIPEPTEQELSSEFSDWDLMSDIEKNLARETVMSRTWRKVISEAKEQATKIEKWNDSVDEFIEDPVTLNNNPGLEGKADAFREFALNEANNSVPFNILVSAFLHDHSSGKESNKGVMFEKGNGGPNDRPLPKTDKLTLQEARKLRETDYNKWKEYNKLGKIDYNI